MICSAFYGMIVRVQRTEANVESTLIIRVASYKASTRHCFLINLVNHNFPIICNVFGKCGRTVMKIRRSHLNFHGT